MSDTESFGRISVPAQTFSRLTAEVQKIRAKGSHYKVNEGKMAAAIIDLFLAKYLEKEKFNLEKAFLDQRKLLKTMIDKATSDDELSSSISAYLNLAKKRGRKKLTQSPNSAQAANLNGNEE